LYEKATINGAGVSVIDYNEARQIEPRIIKKEKYLWSPNTSIADNKGVVKALKKDCERLGVEIFENTGYV